jgi:predicted component of type VI protein secretion system
MSARLVPLNDLVPAPVLLQRPVLLIGRHPDCDIRIDRPEISRRHCCVALAYNRMLIRDLGSRNGLRVNGRVVDEAPLETGDEVAIGPALFRFEQEVAPPPARAPRPKPAAPAPKPPPAPKPKPPAEDDPDSLGFGLIPLDDE